MNEIYQRKENESFLEYTERLIKNRKEYDLDKAEVYELILGEQASSDHSRKSLTAIYKFLNRLEEDGMSNDIKEIHKELNDKDLEQKIGSYKNKIEHNADGTQSSDRLIKMAEEDAKDAEFLLKAHGYNVESWELVSARNNIWNVYSKKDGISELYSSKIVVKPKKILFNEQWIKNVIDKIDFSKRIKKYEYNNIDKTSKTVEINFPDVHIGKFVQELISNGVYNADIAVNRYRNAINEALNRISVYNVKKFIYPLGQDYINFDHLEGTTTKGTRQDMNEFYESVYKKAYKCLLETVEKLRSIAPVHIIYVKGNHDSLSTFTMCYSLSELYEFNNISDVTVDYSTLQRKYIKIGNTTLGLGHGEKEKNKIKECMQVDVPELWNNKYRYFHLSHFHSERATNEIGGVVYKWLGSMSENCKWTYESGYVGAQKKGHVFVYDDEKGLWAEFFINI